MDKILWSIAFPGFGQILNRQLGKGLLFILLELLINAESNLNKAIISSFQGNIRLAIEQTDYQWLMFYPCIYMFAIYDAYVNCEGKKTPYAFLPSVFSAYMGTVGVVYSQTFMVNGVLLGPVWLSIICLLLGASLGYLIKLMIIWLS